MLFHPATRSTPQPSGGPAAQSWQTHTSDGSGSRMSFTFTDADYIKTYIILPPYHM